MLIEIQYLRRWMNHSKKCTLIWNTYSMFKDSEFFVFLTAIFLNRYVPNGILQFIKRNAKRWSSGRCACGNCFQVRRKQKPSMNYVGELPYTLWPALLHFILCYHKYRNRYFTRPDLILFCTWICISN